MNRRSMLKAAAAGIAAACPSGTTAEVLEVTKPLMLVVKHPRHLSPIVMESIRAETKRLLAKTDYPDMPVAITHGGMELHIIEDPRVKVAAST